MAEAAEHRLLNAPYPSRCTCGWAPQLGESVMRAFDRHLLDVAEATPATTTEVMLSRDDYYAVDDEHGDTRVEVLDEQAVRWRRVMQEFDVVQDEMAEAYDAARQRDAEQERIRRAQAEVAAAEARLERAMWEVEHKPDDPASWPLIRVEGGFPCVGPQHPDEKAARAERMRLHNTWPGIRFDLKPYLCVEGHWHIGRTS